MLAARQSKLKVPEAKAKQAEPQLADKNVSQSNPAWQRFALGTLGIQTKLTVSQPDDPYEREADRVAAHVMRIPGTNLSANLLSLGTGAPALTVQRQCEGEVATPQRYIQCDAATTGLQDPTADITAARRLARVRINDALTVLTRLALNPSATGADHFQSLFGAPATAGNVRTVRNVFDRICAWLLSSEGQAGRNIRCQPTGSRRCPRPVRGRVVAGSMVSRGEGDREVTSPRITLCPSTLLDVEEAAGTIIHEAAHVARVLPRPHQRERYEDQSGFPAAGAIHTSADSYAAFARQAHVLIELERLTVPAGGVRETGPARSIVGPGLGE